MQKYDKNYKAHGNVAFRIIIRKDISLCGSSENKKIRLIYFHTLQMENGSFSLLKSLSRNRQTSHLSSDVYRRPLPRLSFYAIQNLSILPRLMRSNENSIDGLQFFSLSQSAISCIFEWPLSGQHHE